MGENPTAVRQEIAHTREEMGETMEAIGYKTDVRSRAGDYVSGKKNKVTGAVSGTKDSVSSAVSRAVPSREGIKDKVSEAGHEAVERGRTVAQEAKDAAVEVVRERGGQETRDLAGGLAGRESSNQEAPQSEIQSGRASAGQPT